MAGDDQNAMEVDVIGLRAHQQRLGSLVDRVQTARDAAGTTLSPDAFGVFGSGLADDCVRSQQEGAGTLQVALDASHDHQQKVGAWADDLDTNELNVVAMFQVGGND